MYRPMAVTVCTALVGSLVLTLAAVPAASRLLLGRTTRKTRQPYMDRAQRVYGRIVNRVLDQRVLVVAAGSLLIAAALGSLRFIGTEFMPRLDEGSVLVQVLRHPSVSLSESVDIWARSRKDVAGVPRGDGSGRQVGPSRPRHRGHGDLRKRRLREPQAAGAMEHGRHQGRIDPGHGGGAVGDSRSRLQLYPADGHAPGRDHFRRACGYRGQDLRPRRAGA